MKIISDDQLNPETRKAIELENQRVQSIYIFHLFFNFLKISFILLITLI